ncbi:MAG: SUMF1/EgtB/PvdO family nonheme iron enzyme [Nitrospirae bacterium]|nr:SUMF1/EgtB/PvdO family nonheme iron enzyme [Nitrospirota bacterium]
MVSFQPIRTSLTITSLAVLLTVLGPGCGSRKPPEPPPPIPPAPKARDDSRFKDVQFIKGKDRREMALIPEGPFPRGSRKLGGVDEQPVRDVTIGAFYMDLFEVTTEEYGRFTAGTGHKKPDIMVFYKDLSLLTGPKQPVVGVDWDDAQAFCHWSGKRLPTEAEWEKAAHGPVEMDWPWGPGFIKWEANVDGDEDGYRYTAPVGSYEGGRSPYGLYDMAGNVSEWVSDWYSPTYYHDGFTTMPTGADSGDMRVHRGGSWNDSISDSRSTKRFFVFPYRRDATVGFRCGMDAPAPSAPEAKGH